MQWIKFANSISDDFDYDYDDYGYRGFGGFYRRPILGLSLGLPLPLPIPIPVPIPSYGGIK